MGQTVAHERSVEERYRALCMLMLVFRYGYYARAKIIISEAQYNAFDQLLRDFEKVFPGIQYPKSPTQTVGSDNWRDYPRSVICSWHEHEETGWLAHWAMDIDELIDSSRAFLKGESSR
ncbi:hypothetical protein LCGC14_1395110 [marine sediment metagenome]|uniref:Uncharacterized protein n=1 Tax=marine sediment metagenome TaxID=412755 RepID=A0A0F9JYT2_9ZZZZ